MRSPLLLTTLSLTLLSTAQYHPHETRDDPFPLNATNVPNDSTPVTSWGAKNDYPFDRCDDPDKWDHPTCQCTSFVAWRLQSRRNIKLKDKEFKKGKFGKAKDWDEAARNASIRVDDKPEVGSVAQKSEGEFGHVAWVTAVINGTVYIEDYNRQSDRKYRASPMGNTSEFVFIHFPFKVKTSKGVKKGKKGGP